MSCHGFEYKYYQRIEYGQKNLSLKTLNKLAKAFGLERYNIYPAKAGRDIMPGIKARDGANDR